ncbi:MAG: AraC family transcriptional regulator [Opitutia bacterium Tous-C1TDCM]|nr:MAG: AraC family transcriptional regulator [Opitutae bacterium Tous-C1TDCM]
MPFQSPPLSFDPNRPDFAPYGLTCVHWRPSPMRRPDHHNEVELNFLESGSVTYLLGGKKTVVEAGKLGVFWAAIPHQIIDFGDDTAYFVATIPLQCFLQWRLPEKFVQPLMQGRLVSEPTAERAASDAQLFAHWEEDLLRKAPDLERPVLLEVQARLIRLALKIPAAPRPRAKRDRLSTLTDSGLNKVEQMACYIAQNYTEKLSVQQIGDFVKLHPNYAMNLFQKTFGTTLINYLTQHRVSHAQRLLATTDHTVTEVAFQSGFLSISRFNDAFRRACGCSPREYRKVHELEETGARRAG